MGSRQRNDALPLMLPIAGVELRDAAPEMVPAADAVDSLGGPEYERVIWPAGSMRRLTR